MGHTDETKAAAGRIKESIICKIYLKSKLTYLNCRTCLLALELT